MAEQNAAANEGQQPEVGEGGKTFTQEQVNEIVRERLARAKAKAPDDYEELKEKAAKYDEAQEAAKSELQRATEQAEMYKAQLEEMQANAKREAEINEAADKHGVDRKLLSLMNGDVEENAIYLAELLKANGYPNVNDGGEQKTTKQTTSQQFAEVFNKALNH